MTSRSSFVRKIVYLVAIAVLLMPLFWLSQPATTAAKGVQGSPGGVLARLRDDPEHPLSQAQLGQIDPTSVTIKLATLGMRGIAANILWEKAREYELKKDWTNRAATLNQITKVQPNFVSIWLNQAWNVSYNISVQFDNYRERYRYVVKGCDFLSEGIKYNNRQPRLPWELGWMISQKIGRADEHKQYRRLFKEDEDFHGSRPVAERDNWLVGKEWFQAAVKMVDDFGVSMMGKGPLIYRSNGPMCQMNYADNLEADGTFGEVAKAAWAAAAAEWHRYGDEDIAGALKGVEPVVIHLNEKEAHDQAAKKLAAEIDAFQPGLRDKLLAERRAALTDAQREALDTPFEKRTLKQIELANQVGDSVQVPLDEVARLITGPQKKEALKLAKEALRHEQLSEYIDSDRGIVNFDYWRMRAEVEQTEDVLAARKQIFQAERAYAENDLAAARNAYRLGFEGWRKVLDRYPAMGDPLAEGDNLMDTIRRYRRFCGQIDEPFPEPFILQDIIDAHEKKAAPAGK